MGAEADPDELLGRAQDAVRILMGLGADGAEAYVAKGSSVSVDVERDVVTYTTGDAESGYGLRVVRDGRLGFAYTSDPQRLEETGRKALALARLAPRRGYSLPPGGGRYRDVPGLFDPALLEMGADEAVEMAGDLVDAAKGVHEGVTVTGAGVGLGHGAAAVANSEGLAVACQGTSLSASAYVVLRDSTVSTGHEQSVSRRRDVDARWVGEAAARMALDAQGAVPLERGGEMTIVFRPTALSELMEFTVVPSVIGDAAQRGESAFTGKEGRPVASPDITLVDDPTLEGGLNSGRADDEGVPARRNVLADRGVLQGFLYDTLTASEYGVETTASAVRGGPGGTGWKAQPEAYVSNVVVEAPTRPTLEELVAEVDRGILVHDVMGAHTSNRTTLDFSVNTTMPFEVRSGEVLGARAPVMMGGNLGAMLTRLVGAGGEARQCPGVLTAANTVLPWMAFDGVTVTP